MQKQIYERLAKTDPIVLTFFAAKKTYAYAKALSDTLWEKVKEANKPIHDANEKGLISDDEWAEKVTDNEYNLGYDDARTCLIDSENSLLKICYEVTKRVAKPEQQEMIKQLWHDGPKYINIREKLVNLALSFDPTI